MEYDMLLIGGPQAGAVVPLKRNAQTYIFTDEGGGQHLYRVEPMKFMGEGGAKMVIFGLYGKMKIEEALQELWAAYAGSDWSEGRFG